jgi:hypothetical protein
VQAAVLVSQSAFDKRMVGERPVGPATMHPSEQVKQGPVWSNLMEGGVRRALIVGVGLQILQQVGCMSNLNLLACNFALV